MEGERGDVGDEEGAQRRSDGIRACSVLSDPSASALSASAEEEKTVAETSRSGVRSTGVRNVNFYQILPKAKS